MKRLQEILEDNKGQYELFEKTEKDILSLSFVKETNISLKASKVGGVGYLPKETDYPKTKEGVPLKLLAQINFSEMPNLSPYPTEGILAFYINTFDDLLGMDFDNQLNQDGFRVLYFDDITKESHSKEEIISLLEDVRKESYDVVEEELLVKGELTTQFLVTDSLDFEKEFGQGWDDYLESHFPEKHAKIADMIFELDSVGGSLLGGYPFFTQEDPRKYIENIFQTELLFQLDTDSQGIMWGDSGVGNFFISKEDLKNKDFSNVFYNWDCY